MSKETPGAIITDIRKSEDFSLIPEMVLSLAGVKMGYDNVIFSDSPAYKPVDGKAEAPHGFSRLNNREKELLVVDRMFGTGLVHLDGERVLVRNRFGEGMFFSPVLVINSNLIDIVVEKRNFSRQTVITGRFIQYHLAHDGDYVGQTPMTLVHQGIYSTPNGIGKRGVHERQAVLEMVWDSAIKVDRTMSPFIRERFLAGDELNFALTRTHRFTEDTSLEERRDKLVTLYRKQIAEAFSIKPREEMPALAAD